MLVMAAGNGGVQTSSHLSDHPCGVSACGLREPFRLATVGLRIPWKDPRGVSAAGRAKRRNRRWWLMQLCIRAAA